MTEIDPNLPPNPIPETDIGTIRDYRDESKIWNDRSTWDKLISDYAGNLPSNFNVGAMLAYRPNHFTVRINSDFSKKLLGDKELQNEFFEKYYPKEKLVDPDPRECDNPQDSRYANLINTFPQHAAQIKKICTDENIPWEDCTNETVCNYWKIPILNEYLRLKTNAQPEVRIGHDIVNFMDHHLYIQAIKNVAGQLPGFSYGEQHIICPPNKIIIGMKGKTLSGIPRNIHGCYDKREFLYTIDGIYVCDAKDICNPNPEFISAHVNWPIPSSWKGSIQTFDIAFSDLTPGFFLSGIWVEVNMVFTEFYLPAQCLIPVITYAGLIIRHYATGEERLYRISGKSNTGKPNWGKPMIIKTQSHFSAISYLRLRTTVAYDLPFVTISAVGKRNMRTTFPVIDYRINTPLSSQRILDLSDPKKNFHPYKPIPGCEAIKKPTDGGFSQWSEWGNCINGKQKRTRVCNNPIPKYGGKDCVGKFVEYKNCIPINGGWSDFLPWTKCINGIQSRVRLCNNPPPSGGEPCIGSDIEYKFCDTNYPDYQPMNEVSINEQPAVYLSDVAKKENILEYKYIIILVLIIYFFILPNMDRRPYPEPE